MEQDISIKIPLDIHEEYIRLARVCEIEPIALYKDAIRLHKEFQRIADLHGVETALLYGQTFVNYLVAHKAQEEGGGVLL